MDITGVICCKAIQTIIEKLFEAERLGKTSDEKIDHIVWPIIKETQKKLTALSRGQEVDLEFD